MSDQIIIRTVGTPVVVRVTGHLPGTPGEPGEPGEPGTFEGVHEDLEGRTDANQHPDTAISVATPAGIGLDEASLNVRLALAELVTRLTSNQQVKAASMALRDEAALTNATWATIPTGRVIAMLHADVLGLYVTDGSTTLDPVGILSTSDMILANVFAEDLEAYDLSDVMSDAYVAFGAPTGGAPGWYPFSAAMANTIILGQNLSGAGNLDGLDRYSNLSEVFQQIHELDLGVGGGGSTRLFTPSALLKDQDSLTDAALTGAPVGYQIFIIDSAVADGLYETDGSDTMFLVEDTFGAGDIVFAHINVALNVDDLFTGTLQPSGVFWFNDTLIDTDWDRLEFGTSNVFVSTAPLVGTLAAIAVGSNLDDVLTAIDAFDLGGPGGLELSDLVRTIEAPSDDVTVTTIAPSDHLITQVVATPSNGERAIVVEPDPALVPLGALLIETVGPPTDVLLQQMGMSAGWDSGAGSWPDPDPVPATGSGFAGSTFGIGDVGGDTNLAGGVSLTFGGYSGGNGHRWRADTDLPGGPLNSVVVSNVAVTGAPADVIIGIAIADGGTPITGWVFSGSGGDITLTPDDPITDLDDIGVLVYVFTTGGAPVPPDSITFDSIDWFTDIDVASVYLGFNNNHTDGTGELNMPFSGPHTHTCTDGTFSPFKSVLKQSDGIAWNLLAGPPRAEYVSTAPYDPFAGIMLGVSNADQALKAIETWINDATMPLGAWSNPHITEDQTEPPGAPDGDFWVHPPA